MKVNKNKLASLLMVGVAGVSLFGLTGCEVTFGAPRVGTTEEAVVTTQKVAFNGFTLELPENYYYQYSSGDVVIAPDKTSPKWAARVGYETNANYEGIYAKRKSVISNLSAYGVTTKKIKTQTIGGLRWIFFEVVEKGQSGIYAYTDATTSSVFCVALFSNSNTYDYTPFTEISSILSKAKNSKSSYNLATDGGIDVGTSPQIDYSKLTDDPTGTTDDSINKELEAGTLGQAAATTTTPAAAN